MAAPARLAPVDGLLPAALALGLPLLAAMLLSFDSNWDLRNYHLYGPHALLSGRHAIDVAAAQLQSWHNPLLDLPLYALSTSGLPMRLTTLWLVLPAALSLWSLLGLHGMLQSPGAPAGARALRQVVLCLMVVSGAAFGSTLGLSMNDGFVCAGILWSLRLAMDPERAARGESRGWLLAGLVAGATAGLKLSAAFYCLALALAALPGDGGRQRLSRLMALAAGGVVGFSLAYGFWGWRLATEFGNPFFPYFNQVFQSPFALPQSHADARFRPDGLLAALLAPLRLLADNQLFSELRLRDPRVLGAILGFAWLAWHADDDGSGRRVVLRRLLVFVLAGVATWLAQSGIYRYAIALEALGALAIVLALQRLPRARSVLVLALVLVVGATRQPHWGRDASGASLVELQAPALGDGALVMTATGDPLAYLALGLDDAVPLLGLGNNLMQPDRCTKLQVRASSRLHRHRGPLWLLEDPSQDPAPGRELLRLHYGLVPTGPCLDYSNPIGPARLCELERSAQARAPCLPEAPAKADAAAPGR